jgi:hypothetical protein
MSARILASEFNDKSFNQSMGRTTRAVMQTFLTLALLAVASATVASAQKVTDTPPFIEYKGVRIGMDMNEARKKLGKPADKGDAQDFFMFSEKESCQVFYDKVHQVMAVSVNYIGDGSGAPLPKVVLGTEIEAKADGSIYKLVRYPASGY